MCVCGFLRSPHRDVRRGDDDLADAGQHLLQHGLVAHRLKDLLARDMLEGLVLWSVCVYVFMYVGVFVTGRGRWTDGPTSGFPPEPIDPFCHSF